MQSWVPVKDAERLAVAVYPFLGSGQHQIPFSIGDTLHILQRCGAWYYGYATNNRAFKGIFPCSFVRIKRCVVDKSLKGAGTVIARENPLLHEVTSVLREWGHIWKKLYETSDPALKPVSDMLHDLIRQRRKIIAGTLPTDELRHLKRQVTATIDRGNELLKLDLVVRDDQGNIVNPDLTSAVKLYRHHQQAASRSQDSEGERALKRTQQHNSHCLYVTVQNCVCRLDEDAEIVLLICDASDPGRLKVLTEPYVVTWKEGLEKNMDQLSSLRVLYTDLSNSDIASDRLFLVGYVVKVGSSAKHDAAAGRRSMQISHKPAKKTVEMCRRPFGAAAIDLSSAMASAASGDEDGKHRFMPILTCGDKDSLEDTARRLVRDISGRDSKGQGLWVTLRLLHGEKEQHPHLAKMALARRLGFPDVILPTDVRNDLYLTLHSGEFTRGSKVQDRNVEVTVKVCNRDGSVRHGVIERGAGCPPVEEYRSVVYWHESRPRWAETLKVVLPIEGDCDSHVRFTFKHRSNNEVKDKSEKPFGLAYVNLLQSDCTTLRNTRHELNVYKINSKSYEEGDTSYLNLPALKSDIRDGQPRPESGPYLLSLRDSFSLESITCSTKLTQDVDLLGLLKWSSDPGSLKERLARLDRIRQEELVKFLRDSLDALFHILIHYETDDTYDVDVFNALVTIISSVTTERRYQHFQPVLEAYLQSAFSATIVDRKLMGVLQTYIDNVRDPESRLHLLKALSCLRYVFKFIIKSRQLYIKMNGGHDAASFGGTTQHLLRSFTGLMLDRDTELESVQEAMLQHLPSAVDDLTAVCDPVQLSEAMAELVRTLANGNLTERKLSVISRLVHSQLFSNPDGRHVLLPEVVAAVGLMFDLQQQNGAGGMATLRQRNKRSQKLAQMLGEQRTDAIGLDKARDELQRSRDELQLCIGILSDVLDVLWRQHGQRGGTSIDVGVVTQHLLRKVLQTVVSVDREDTLVCGLVAILISMLRQMERHHYDQYMSGFTDVTDQLAFITEILMVFKDLVSKCVYPPLWCEMIMLQNSVILKSLRLFSYTIRDRFLEPYEHQIWNNFFHCAISFLTQSPLQLETFSASKRSRLLARYKDMRKATAEEIRTMWIRLGQHKIAFVPALVGPFLEMTLVPDPELRGMTIPLFFDMMQCEFYSPIKPGSQYNDTKRQASASKCNFNEFEHEMINKVDHLIDGGRGDDFYRELFREKMLELCEKHSSMREQGVRFVATVTDLMKRLLEYRAIMRDENQENKMSCTVNLLHFYYEIHCQEMYIRYLYKLRDLHVAANNYIEAGFTLKLHADQLQWSDEQLPAVLRHRSDFGPLETHRAMKEALYNKIIDYFDRGNLWEAALQLCKELSGQYEEATFDYHQLSQLLQRMSRLYDKILQEIRPVPAYFRVAFYGRGFPAFLQNKVYVYRGRGYERLAEFSSRIQDTFPKAELMDTLETPGPEVTESLQQLLQVNSVDPDMEDNKRFSGKPVTEKIVQYYRVNDIDRFVYSRRSQRGAKDPDNPFASMWLQRTVMRTSSKLPGILAWFPVTATETYDVTPLEHAIETMTTKNRQLRELILSNRSDAALPLNPLTQTLTGIINPAVMGGTANYQTFFTPEYVERNPDDATLVAKLKVLIAKQIPLLEAGLETHGQRAPDNLKPLQTMLEGIFDDMRTEVQDKFGVQECDLPYQRPVVALRHHRPSLAGWERQDSSLSDLSSTTLTSPQNGTAPFLSLMNLSQSFSSGGTLKSQKSATSLPRSKTIFYSQASNLSAAGAVASTPVRSRDRRDQKRGSITSQTSESTIILSEELRPARPLRSEVERERRLTRPCSGQYSLRHSPSTSTLSSRDSLGPPMDEDSEPPPPPLPAKQSRQMSMHIEPDGQDLSSLLPEPLPPSQEEPPPKPPLGPPPGESSV
ncbi:dedicator of cytokinesis protein 1-like isoform X2 [Amphibalanus amphitrite]|uniref:dedicator of cytokinesis protein 1-like isoform X2 n=1 Tax=Amphibalanus amphitrite TaxID=1232801 RepID=UPI001C90DFAE|nr:dedicator of cytokinesis protein 1-like isoform X2 [Amphibalanus amphitrite]